MKRMKLFGTVLILAAAVLIPKTAPAASFCSFQQCYLGLRCAPSDCPDGYRNVPQCSAPYCVGYCACIPNAA